MKGGAEADYKKSPDSHLWHSCSGASSVYLSSAERILFVRNTEVIPRTVSMEITIKTLTGTSHTMMVSPGGTVSSLKFLIQTKLNIPTHSQKLAFLNGQNIPLNDDNRTLSDYGLHPGSVVTLLVTDPAPFQVFLKNEKGQMSTYDIKPDITVQEFKTKVYARERVPVDQQRLILEGKEMMQGTLADYGVKPLATIYMTLRLRGG